MLVGGLLLFVWQGRALAIEEPGDLTGTATATAEDATSTVETTSDEVVAAAGSAVEGTSSAVTDAATTSVTQVDESTVPDIPIDVAEQPSNTTSSKDAQDKAPADGGSGAPTSSGNDSQLEPSGPSNATEGSDATTVVVTAPVNHVEIENSSTYALTMALKKKLNPDLEALIAAGENVDGTVVLGEQINSTSSRVREEPASSGSQLAFTGADLLSLTLVAMLLLLFGYRAASTKERRVVRPVRPVAHKLDHIRFA